MKGKFDSINGYKQRLKVWLVYLEIKLHQDKCGWGIYKLKCHKNDRNEVFRGKQQWNMVPLLRLNVKMLKERYDWRF